MAIDARVHIGEGVPEEFVNLVYKVAILEARSYGKIALFGAVASGIATKGGVIPTIIGLAVTANNAFKAHVNYAGARVIKNVAEEDGYTINKVGIFESKRDFFRKPTNDCNNLINYGGTAQLKYEAATNRRALSKIKSTPRK